MKQMFIFNLSFKHFGSFFVWSNVFANRCNYIIIDYLLTRFPVEPPVKGKVLLPYTNITFTLCVVSHYMLYTLPFIKVRLIKRTLRTLCVCCWIFKLLRTTASRNKTHKLNSRLHMNCLIQ